jgi:hypothetical protein
MAKLSAREAVLIDSKNILAKLNQLIIAQGKEKLPETKKILCYNPAHYEFTPEKSQEICDRYWQIIELWQLAMVKKYLKQTQQDVNIVISTCDDHIQIAKHKDKRISTCVHYISFRVSGVYWYKPKYNISVALPIFKNDLAVMLKTKGTYTSDILVDGLNLLNWEQEKFTENVLQAFRL